MIPTPNTHVKLKTNKPTPDFYLYHYKLLSTGIKSAKDEMLRISKELLLSSDLERNKMLAFHLDEYERILEQWRALTTDQ